MNVFFGLKRICNNKGFLRRKLLLKDLCKTTIFLSLCPPQTPPVKIGKGAFSVTDTACRVSTPSPHPFFDNNGKKEKLIFEKVSLIIRSLFVPTPNPSRDIREGLTVLYSGDFVPTPLFGNYYKGIVV